MKSLIPFLCKDYGCLKIFFTFMCLFMIVQEFYTAFVERPTLTTTKKEPMKQEDIPDILICPDPPISIDELQSLGYVDMWDYKAGGLNLETQNLEFSWKGNTTESVKNISNKISVFNSTADCPHASIEYFDPEDQKELLTSKEADMKLSPSLFPYHVCCKVIIPNLPEEKIIRDVYIWHMDYSFNVLLSDRMASSLFTQSNKNVFGELRLVANRTVSYLIKIFQEINLPNNPTFECVEYQQFGDYDACLESRIVSETLSFVNCTPPWMTEKEEFWCHDEEKFESFEDMKNFHDFLLSVNIRPMRQCSVPCKSSKFEVNNRGFMDGGRALTYLTFDTFTEKTVAERQVGPLTLVSRLGGFIGIGKNLLWIVTVLFSSMKIFSLRVTQRNS